MLNHANFFNDSYFGRFGRRLGRASNPCEYVGERVTYATAVARCAALNRTVERAICLPIGPTTTIVTCTIGMPGPPILATSI